MDVALEKHQTQVGPVPKSVWCTVEWANGSEFFRVKNIGILWPFAIGFEKFGPFGEEWCEIQKKCLKLQQFAFHFQIFVFSLWIFVSNVARQYRVSESAALLSRITGTTKRCPVTPNDRGNNE